MNDLEVTGSLLGSIVYFRGIRESALVNNSELAARWGVSRATVFRILKKLQGRDFIDAIHFTGASGSVIYTKNYMQTMFDVEELYIDRDEVVTVFETTERMKPEAADCPITYTVQELSEENGVGSKEEFIGSKWDSKRLVSKVREVLINKGFSELLNTAAIYRLSPLSLDCKGNIKSYILTIVIHKKELCFEVRVSILEGG